MSLARNSFSLFSMRLLSFGFGLAGSVLLTRALGAESRGAYYMLGTISGLASGILTLGLGGAFAYHAGRGERPLEEINFHAVFFAACAGLLALCAYGLFRKWLLGYLSGIPEPLFLASLLTVPFTIYGTLWRSAAIGSNNIAWVSRLTNFQTVIGFLATYLVLYPFGWGLAGLVALSCVMSPIYSVIQYWLLSGGTASRFRLRWSFLRETLSFGMTSHVGDLAQMVFSRLDVFFVERYCGLSGLGIYSLALSIAEKIGFLTSPVMSAANHSITSSSPEAIRGLILKLVRHIFLLSCLAGLFLLIVAPAAIPFLYGQEFRGAVHPLVVLVPGILFAGLTLPLSGYFTYYLGKPTIPTLCGWATLVVNVPLCAVLSSRFGLAGAALAATATFAFQFALYWFLFRSHTGSSLASALRPSQEDLAAYGRLVKVLHGEAVAAVSRRRAEREVAV